MQQFYQQNTGELPTVELIVECLRRGSIKIVDGDDEKDNVPHSNKSYPRIDALLALEAIRRNLQLELLTTQVAFR